MSANLNRELFRLAVSLLGCAAVGALAPQVGVAGSCCKKDKASTATVTAAPAAGGLKMVLDSKGERVTSPSPEALPKSPVAPRSGEGLVERKAPNGGVIVDVGTRFHSASVATISPDGKLNVDCVPLQQAPQEVK